MSKQITIPDGSDVKSYLKGNWKTILPWILLLIACVFLYKFIFHGKALPPKVKDTQEYKAIQRENDSLLLVINRARDSVGMQGEYLQKVETALTIQKSSYRMSEAKLYEILHRPAYSLPDYTDSYITDYLNRKYGDSATQAAGTDDGSR